MIFFGVKPTRRPLRPVLQREARQLRVVVDPFELQGPASLSHAGQHHLVVLQVELAASRLRLEVRRYVVCKEHTVGYFSYHPDTCKHGCHGNWNMFSLLQAPICLA